MNPNDEWPDPERQGGPAGPGPAGGPVPEAPRGYPQPGPGQYHGPANNGGPGPQQGYYPQVPPGYGPPQPQYSVAPKNPGVALLASFFIPGLGSMMNGDVGKGVAILIGYIVSWFLIIILIGVVGCVGFWIWGMVDGYQGARKWNAAHGIVS